MADFDRGVAYIKKGAFEEAIPYLEKALEAKPDHAKAEFYRAVELNAMARELQQAFIPEEYNESLRSRITPLTNVERSIGDMPYPRITFLENVVPWNYVTWDRKVTALEDDT